MSKRSAAKSNRKRPSRRWKHTVLWVDDDPNISAAIARRLKRDSIRVIPASDGMQGYWLALTRKPDAVVTDLRMPRWKGEDLVECLTRNEVTRGLPTVVLSGYASDLSDEYLSRHNIEAVLDKPVCYEALLAALERCWNKPSRQVLCEAVDAAV